LDFKSEDEKWDFRTWIKDGGLSTLDGYIDLPEKEKKEIYDYIEKAKSYVTLEFEGKKYILVHAEIADFEESKELDEYTLLDFIYKRADYSKRYYSDEKTFLVTGHTPTMFIFTNRDAKVFMKNGHIAIDCGCVYGGKLAAYCIETGEVEYVGGATKEY